MASSGASDVEKIDAIVQPHQIIAGEAQSAWSDRWWHWASSFQYSESPIADRSGDRCDAGQAGSVWFLAGALGSVPVKRQCVVPLGKYLFLPIVNYSVSTKSAKGSEAPNAMACEQLSLNAKELTNHPTDLALIVDDQEVRDLTIFRQASTNCFNPYQFNPGERIQSDRSITAANGYFVMLKPLAPGRHVIKWGGVLPSVRQAVIYELTVGEPAKKVD